jgi:hypothetical protein
VAQELVAWDEKQGAQENFQAEQQRRRVVAQQQAEPEPQIALEEVERENRAQIDQEATKAKLIELRDKFNLLPSAANHNLIKAFLDKHIRGYWSAQGVQAAFDNLGPKGANVLTFYVPLPITFLYCR